MAENTFRGPRFCLLFSHFALLSLLGLMGVAWMVDPSGVDITATTVKIGVLHMVGLYPTGTLRALADAIDCCADGACKNEPAPADGCCE